MTNSKAKQPAVIKRDVKKALAKVGKGSTRFITILQDDFQYDLIQEIIDVMGIIKRSKKIKPLDKYRVLQTYHLALLSYCIPKMKVTEDAKTGIGDKVQFNINVGGAAAPAQPKIAGGVNITIPAKKQADGQYTVDP